MYCYNKNIINEISGDDGNIERINRVIIMRSRVQGSTVTATTPADGKHVTVLRYNIPTICGVHISASIRAIICLVLKLRRHLINPGRMGLSILKRNMRGRTQLGIENLERKECTLQSVLSQHFKFWLDSPKCV